MTVPDEIEKLAALYAEKHGAYGDTEDALGLRSLRAVSSLLEQGSSLRQ